MTSDVIHDYAMRKAREEAHSFISKHTRCLGNEELVKLIGGLLAVLEKEEPSRAYNLDFLDVLHSLSNR